MDKDTELYNLIIKLLEKAASSEEIAYINNWRIDNPKNEQTFQEIKFLWENTTSAKPDLALTIDETIALQKVHQQIEISNKKVFSRRKFLYAVITSIIILSLLLVKSNNTKDIIEIATKTNQKQKIILPDSSIVWLNENSNIKYPKVFNKSTRKIKLKGNAVFDVTHNENQAFIVESNEMIVKVLGTTFNVDSNTDSTSFVHVLDGKVQVENRQKGGDKLIITRGETAKINHNSNHLTLSDSYNQNDLFWMHQTLSYSNTSLKVVFQDLEKYFLIDIVIQNKELLNCPVNGIFKNKTIDEILETLQIIYSFEIRKLNKTTYQISKGRCN